MQEEIKEILEFDFESQGERIEINEYERNILKDYITNLQEEIEELREDNYAYHQLMKMQNEREYRSKFLKEFQEEFGKNVLPDYDEIYKRYDKLKEENEMYKKELEKADSITQSCIFEGSRSAGKSYRQCLNWLEDYKSRNEKIINKISSYRMDDITMETNRILDDLLNTARGVDKE